MITHPNGSRAVPDFPDSCKQFNKNFISFNNTIKFRRNCSGLSLHQIFSVSQNSSVMRLWKVEILYSLTLSSAFPTTMSSVYFSVYTLKCSLLYTFSLYTHLSALDIHSHSPTLNTILYIQCGWVGFGPDQGKAMHLYISWSCLNNLVLQQMWKK